MDSTVTKTVLDSKRTILVDSDTKLNALELNEATKVWYIFGRSIGDHGSDPKIIILSDGRSTAYTLEVAKLNSANLLDKLSGVKNIVGYDLKSELKRLIKLELSKLPTVEHDIMVGAFLINSLPGEQTLTELVNSELGYTGSSFEDLDEQELIIRSHEIIAAIQAIYEKQLAELKKLPRIQKLAQDIEWPVISVLARMEVEGIKLDVNYLKKFSIQIDKSISELEQQIYAEAKQQFNISSPSQLAEVLFGLTNLALPTSGIKKTKSGYSTAASELDKLRGLHPIVDHISKYREVTKLKNTYIDALPKQVDENSRLHTTFSLTTAQTGRLSSVDPNLQNIPIRTDLGRNIRTAFVADEGKTLISADYSQFELRLEAVLAGDKQLIDMFNRGADIHTLTAAQVYGRELEDVTKQMRRAAKVINFGILYGMSPHGLSVAAGMTHEQAQDFIDKYKELRKPIFKYIDEVMESAKRDGYVETMFGRRRMFPDIHSSNFIVRQAAERAAINVPSQGTEADLMKMAMVKSDEYLRSQHNECHILLQIHDSILVECPDEIVQNVSAGLKEVMESVYKLPVNLTVDITHGKNWGEL